jgi:tripartite ATP-independent transporter DctM subunit
MLLLFASFIILMILGLPVGFSLLVSSVWFLTAHHIPVMVAAQRVAAGVDSFPLLALAFFILAGALMNSAGITTKIFDFADKLVGHFTGGLGHANILASVIFSGMSGSAAADAGGLGAIELKAMKEAGFDEAFSLAVTGASSVIGPIIPPSVPAVVFGVAAGVSLGKLFIGGIIPGLIMAVVMSIMIYLISKKRNYPKRVEFNFSDLVQSFIKGFWALITPAILIIGIITGMFTPTEASIVAVVYALILGLIYRTLTLRNLPKIILDAVNTTVCTLFIIAASTLFAWILTTSQVPQHVSTIFLSVVSNKYIAIFIINIILLVVGCFLDVSPAIVLFVPIFMPVINAFHMDPVHFGIVMILNLMIGLLTPPIGIVLYVLSSVSKISFEKIAKAVWPFVGVLFLVLLLITYVPALVTYLPNLMIKQ